MVCGPQKYVFSESPWADLFKTSTRSKIHWVRLEKSDVKWRCQNFFFQIMKKSKKKSSQKSIEKSMKNRKKSKNHRKCVDHFFDFFRFFRFFIDFSIDFWDDFFFIFFTIWKKSSGAFTKSDLAPSQINIFWIGLKFWKGEPHSFPYIYIYFYIPETTPGGR